MSMFCFVATVSGGDGKEKRPPFLLVGACRKIGKCSPMWSFCLQPIVGCAPKGHTATQRSKKGSEKVLGRVLGKGSGEGVLRRVLRRGPALGFTVKKGF